MPKAILRAIDDKWRVIIVDDDDLDVIYTSPLKHSEALEVANDYNWKEMIVRLLQHKGKDIFRGKILSLN
jgi:hypothetical protein